MEAIYFRYYYSSKEQNIWTIASIFAQKDVRYIMLMAMVMRMGNMYI